MTEGRMIEVVSGGVLLHRVLRMESFIEQARGLLGRPSPGRGEGMLFPGCRSIHTVGMVYSIDVLFLDGDGGIVGMDLHLKPYRLSSCRQAASALELAAGEAGRLGLSMGMHLLWQPR